MGVGSPTAQTVTPAAWTEPHRDYSMPSLETDTRHDATRAFDTVVSRLRTRLPHAVEEIFLPGHLIVRTDGMPDWWSERNNILLAPAGVGIPLPSYAGMTPPRNAVVVVGPYCTLPNQMMLLGDGPIVFLGPHCSLPNGHINCSGPATIVMAGNIFAIDAANLDARNGGLIYVGDDNLWSSNVKVNTDDMHAIFDRASLKRINRYGSVVAVGTHVWLGSDVLINPGADIHDNCVVGSRSVVTKAIPAGGLAVGVPARVVRRGVTWTREDILPGSSPLDLNLAAREPSLRRLASRLERTWAGAIRRIRPAR